MNKPRPIRPTRPDRSASILRAAYLDGSKPSAGEARMRRLVADFCRMLDPKPGIHANGNGHSNGNGNGHADGSGRGAAHRDDGATDSAAGMSPRMRQTLDRLLSGDSEKEIAARFGRSPHTVHVYVKRLYRRYGVSSRGELFALFVQVPPFHS